MVYLGGGSLKISTNMGIELACRGRVMFTSDASLCHFCCGNLRQVTELPRPRRSPLSMYMMIMVLKMEEDGNQHPTQSEGLVSVGSCTANYYRACCC